MADAFFIPRDNAWKHEFWDTYGFDYDMSSSLCWAYDDVTDNELAAALDEDGIEYTREAWTSADWDRWFDL